VDVVGHTSPLPDQQQQQQVCVVSADEFQYLGDIDVFDCKEGAGDSASTQSSARIAATEETVLMDELEADGLAAAGVDLNIEPTSTTMIDPTSLLLNPTPKLQTSNRAASEQLSLSKPQFADAVMSESLDTPSTEKLLDDLWLESTLNSVDDWNEDNLFPDLI